MVCKCFYTITGSNSADFTKGIRNVYIAVTKKANHPLTINFFQVSGCARARVRSHAVQPGRGNRRAAPSNLQIRLILRLRGRLAVRDRTRVGAQPQ